MRFNISIVSDDINEKENRDLYFLNPEKDNDDKKYMHNMVTHKFVKNKRICKEFDKVDMVEQVVYKKAVIKRSVYNSWMEKMMANKTYKKIEVPKVKYCKDCGLEEWSENFIKWDGEMYYHPCECYMNSLPTYVSSAAYNSAHS